MAKKNYYTLKRGEVGTVMEFTLSDSDGAVNLGGWTVTLTARKKEEAAAIEDASCTVLANQSTTGKGKGTYTFDSTTAAIPAGTYQLEFKGTSPGGAVYYFPKSPDKPYAVLNVVEALS